MRKILALIVLVIVLVTTSNGCDKTEAEPEIQLDIILSTVDYMMNMRYNGIDTVDYERLKLELDSYTYDKIAEQFSRDIKDYISVEMQYREAESAFRAYQNRIFDSRDQQVEINENVENYSENELEYEEEQEEYEEGDPGESFSSYELMLDNIYNVQGELLWESITLEEAEQKTVEEIEEFLSILQDALDSFSEKGKENRAEREERERIERERLEDAKLPGKTIVETEVDIDFSELTTDDRIKLLGDTHVIMLEDIGDTNILQFDIYGIDYSIDVTDLKKPYSYCKGNDIYKFGRVYYAMYDNGIIYVTYSSIDEVNNKVESVELEIRLIDGKINIADIDKVVTTKY